MNERIQELAEQAGFTVENGHIQSLAYKEIEKLTELIVRECVEYYRSQIGETSEPHTKTLEHFGVES